MSGLVLEGMAGLEYLDCLSLPLDTLDLSECPRLREAYIGGARLTALDLRENPSLERLFCTDCGLRSLDVSGCSALTALNCSGNRLGQPDGGTTAGLGGAQLQFQRSRLARLERLPGSRRTGLSRESPAGIGRARAGARTRPYYIRIRVPR